MNFGYFDNEKREYVIVNPKTPVKWINYVGSLDFGGFIDHTGGTLICKGDPALNRITKYIPQLPASDFKGGTAYIRIKENEEYKIFSPYYVPTLDKYEHFECHIGLQYTRFITRFYGIRTDITIFVPHDGQQLICDYKIQNSRNVSVELDFIPVVEYTHPDALKQFTNADWIPQTMQSKLIQKDNQFTIISQFAFMNQGLKENYFTSNFPISSFETDRRIFLGDNEYGTWKNPISLHNTELSNTEAYRGDNISALMHHLGELKPQESVRIVTQLGQTKNIETAFSDILRYQDVKNVDEEFEKIKIFWDETLSKQQVYTPDKDMNTMLNIHNPFQCYITKNWSRYLSLYQLGLGARGIGFRDSAQDVMGLIPLRPEESKELIKTLLHVQKINGSAMHQFNPITMIANEGDSAHEEDRPSYYGDDHLWIVLSVSAYLKETGDMDFLKEIIPFYEKDKMGKPFEVGTILDHLERAIEFTHKNIGNHGLPLLGFADWNDSVNLPEGAESIFVANLFGKALLEMIDLMEYLGKAQLLERYKKYYQLIKENISKNAWDGEWYIRYFDETGNPIGSKKNQKGKIYANAQSWSVFSGFASEARATSALESVYKYLNTRNGIKLSMPGYDHYDPKIGGVTSYPPGAKENSGIFLHANTWVIIAETLNDNGDRAFLYYDQLNPVKKNDKINEFESAPYNYPQNILADEHPQFGLARNSWLSGTASWMYQAGTKYILGIQPEHNGLKINPCIPKQWDGFKIERVFRNATYKITVKNSEHISKGVKSIVVDGMPIKSNIIPIFNDYKTHIVNVEMGKDK